MAEMSIVNGASDGTVQYARISGVDRLDLIGQPAVPVLEDLVASGWEIRAASSQNVDGTTTGNTVIFTR